MEAQTLYVPETATVTEEFNEPLVRPVMPELDALRGIAILMVLLYHGLYWGIDLNQIPAGKRQIFVAMWVGRLGVNLFFVLSGFLITGSLMNTRARPYYYRRFYLRRALRILPALVLTLVLLLAARAVPLKFALLSLAYLANLAPLFGVAIAYPVLWSLAVEEHFYLGWPWVVRRFSNRAVLALCMVIVAVSPLLRLISFQLAHAKGWVSFEIFDYTWNSSDGLACGAGLAVFLREFAPTRKKLASVLFSLVILAAAIWAVALPFGILTRRTAVGAALQVVPWHFLFVAVLGFFLLGGTSPRKRWMAPRFLTFFGKISYGLYLYHLMCFWMIGFLSARAVAHGQLRRDWIEPPWGLCFRLLLAGVPAVLMAWVSRKCIEEPFLRLKDRWTQEV
jgi:peptidoglycan/LPS O-acetylase OafA/YrhL